MLKKFSERGSVSLVASLALSLVAAFALFLESLSIDFTGMLDQAFTLANSLWPIFVVPIGLALGIGLVSWIAGEIKSTMRFK